MCLVINTEFSSKMVSKNHSFFRKLFKRKYVTFYKRVELDGNNNLITPFQHYKIYPGINRPKTTKVQYDNLWKHGVAWNLPEDYVIYGGCLHLHTKNADIHPKMLRVKVDVDDIIAYGYERDVTVKKYYVSEKEYKRVIKECDPLN